MKAAQSPVASDTPAPGIEGAPRIIQLGPGNDVNIQIYGQPDMTTIMYVSDDGTNSVPLTGSVQIAGLSTAEANPRIEKALKNRMFLVDPHLSLTAMVSRSQRVSVLGQVGKPRAYSIESNATVFDLAMVGAAFGSGSDQIFLLRKDAVGTLQRYPINPKGSNDSREYRVEPGRV